MSAPTTARSAYPVPVDELLPRARELANRLGSLPSRNRLKTELRVGAPKAKALLDALTRPEPAKPTTGTEPGPAETASTSPPPAPTPAAAPDAAPLVNDAVDPVPDTAPAEPVRRTPRAWPVLLLALPAFVAIWSGWVGLGGLTGFGVVHPLPGIWDSLAINTAITLPIGVETYAAFALRVWLSPGVPPRARRFARWSAIGSLILGGAGQVAYHLLVAAGVTAAPAWITTLVACLPVAVLGMGAALVHLLHTPDTD